MSGRPGTSQLHRISALRASSAIAAGTPRAKSPPPHFSAFHPAHVVASQSLEPALAGSQSGDPGKKGAGTGSWLTTALIARQGRLLDRLVIGALFHHHPDLLDSLAVGCRFEPAVGGTSEALRVAVLPIREGKCPPGVFPTNGQ